MAKNIRRRARLLFLASMLVAAIGGSNFSSQTAHGEAPWTCPVPVGCGNWGCFVNGMGEMRCTLYNFEGSTHCNGSIACDPPPIIE
jgi:hypothetical protein